MLKRNIGAKNARSVKGNKTARSQTPVRRVAELPTAVDQWIKNSITSGVFEKTDSGVYVYEGEVYAMRVVRLRHR